MALPSTLEVQGGAAPVGAGYGPFPVLSFFGIAGPAWLSSFTLALPTVAFVTVWQSSATTCFSSWPAYRASRTAYKQCAGRGT